MSDDEDPFDSLDDYRDREGDPFESEGSTFERAGVEGIDPDEVWVRLTADADERAEAGVGDDEAVDAPPEADDDVVAVSKHDYCEGCEHFSRPPDVACTHEGTDILEFVDVDTVRVVNCPVVAERRDLDDG